MYSFLAAFIGEFLYFLQLLLGNSYIFLAAFIGEFLYISCSFYWGIPIYFLQLLLGNFYILQLLLGNSYISCSFYWCGCESSGNSDWDGDSAGVLSAYEYSDDRKLGFLPRFQLFPICSNFTRSLQTSCNRYRYNVKHIKRTPEKFWCNHPKILTRWLYCRVMHPKDADRIANSVDTDL